MAEDARPLSDPTPLTTDALLREIANLKELVTSILDERDRRYEDRYRAQQENVTVALAAVSEASRVALVATEKAIDKSELATKEAINKAEGATEREFRALNAKVDAQGGAFTAALQTVETRMAQIAASLQ